MLMIYTSLKSKQVGLVVVIKFLDIVRGDTKCGYIN